MADSFKESALIYHTDPTPGKLAIMPTKPLANKRDLSLAYSPGVAYACELIERDPTKAASVTSRGIFNMSAFTVAEIHRRGDL